MRRLRSFRFAARLSSSRESRRTRAHLQLRLPHRRNRGRAASPPPRRRVRWDPPMGPPQARTGRRAQPWLSARLAQAGWRLPRTPGMRLMMGRGKARQWVPRVRLLSRLPRLPRGGALCGAVSVEFAIVAPLPLVNHIISLLLSIGLPGEGRIVGFLLTLSFRCFRVVPSCIRVGLADVGLAAEKCRAPSKLPFPKEKGRFTILN